MLNWRSTLHSIKQYPFISSIIRLWNFLVSIGLIPEMSDWDRKRVRLLNGMLIMGILALTEYCISYLDAIHWLTFWESFQGIIAYLFILVLNSKHKYNAACHSFCIYNLISYSFEGITHGPIDGVEYILVVSSIASMLLFKNTKIIVLYFILNAGFFALCKYSYTVMKPVLFMANGESLYTANHVLMFVILFLIVNYFKTENTRQEKLLESKNKSLEVEKDKSDHLLLNILPDETAEELKQTGVAKSKSFASATVLFTDFKDFTMVSEKMSPEKLVGVIHHYFSSFDAIIDKYHIEKIKTIGDSYMCAGGIPEENSSHAIDVVRAALEIQEFMLHNKSYKDIVSDIVFELRLGIHTGPVVAGIVGTKKFAYDIWGDTVNIASRMERSGEVGRVNISGSTYELVKDHFNCTHRGKIPAKNKGDIDMYFVDSIKT